MDLLLCNVKIAWVGLFKKILISNKHKLLFYTFGWVLNESFSGWSPCMREDWVTTWRHVCVSDSSAFATFLDNKTSAKYIQEPVSLAKISSYQHVIVDTGLWSLWLPVWLRRIASIRRVEGETHTTQSARKRRTANVVARLHQTTSEHLSEVKIINMSHADPG